MSLGGSCQAASLRDKLLCELLQKQFVPESSLIYFSFVGGQGSRQSIAKSVLSSGSADLAARWERIPHGSQ